MFDIGQFIVDCQRAVEQPEPTKAVKKLVQEAISSPAEFKAAIAKRGKADSLKGAILFRSENLTVLPVTTAPGMLTPAHDHQMWAVIGIIDGVEPNDFFSDKDGKLVKKGTKILNEGDVAALDGRAIHAISNPLDVECYAIHVYGGDLVDQPGRSMWNPHTLAREPYDIVKLGEYVREIAEMNAGATAG